MSQNCSQLLGLLDSLPNSSTPEPDMAMPSIGQMLSSIYQERSPNGKLNKNKPTIKCPLPNCTFTTHLDGALKKHMEYHEQKNKTEKKLFQCDLCDQIFTQLANMRRHRQSHSEVKPFECEICQKRFFRKDQNEEHMLVHIRTGTTFECPLNFCNEQFSKFNNLRRHLEFVHAGFDLKCKDCKFATNSIPRLITHYQLKHMEFTSNKVSKDVMDLKTLKTPGFFEELLTKDQPSTSAPEPLLQFIQNFQGVDFQTLPSLNNIAIAAPEPIIHESSVSPISMVQSPKIEEKVEEMNCPHCGLEFIDNMMYMLHMTLHTVGNPFKCGLCGEECGEKYTFTSHIIFNAHKI